MTSAPAELAAFAESRVRLFDVVSDDGTRLRAWTNNATGPTVLLCNGLGTNPYAWPALLDPDCGVHVISWYHRGTGGSERPRDRDRVGMDAFIEDALTVLDAAGVGRVPVMGWSIGVNTAFELAWRHPERVSGLFAVGGVPGRTFATMLGPLHLPQPVNETITVNTVRLGRVLSPALTPVTTAVPVGPGTVQTLSRTGFMLGVDDQEAAAAAMREFLTTPAGWYCHLALHASRHQRVSLSGITVPTSFVAGRWDVLAGPRQMATAAERMPDADFTELHGSHFLPLEQPMRIHQLLRELLGRAR